MSSWRASISASRSASGPSQASSWTWVAASGRRPSPRTTAGAAPGAAYAMGVVSATVTSVRLVRETEQLAVLRIDRRFLVADQLDGPWRAAGAGRERRRGLGVHHQALQPRPPAGDQ